ncbi:hypothetical protein ACQ4LE_005825 [Meloidogyne hapla]
MVKLEDIIAQADSQLASRHYPEGLYTFLMNYSSNELDTRKAHCCLLRAMNSTTDENRLTCVREGQRWLKKAEQRGELGLYGLVIKSKLLGFKIYISDSDLKNAKRGFKIYKMMMLSSYVPY